MAGWIKLHRKLFESELWHDTTACRLFLLIVGQAVHKDGIKIDGVELKRGQFLRSFRKLAEDLGYKEGRGIKSHSVSTIKRAVQRLIDSGRVSVQETEHGTLFTVLNYALYQEKTDDEEENAERNAERTRNEDGTNAEQKQELKNVKNVRNKDKKNRHVFDEKQMKLAELLWKYVQQNDPAMKKPSLPAWANTIRLMMERDERDGKEIQEIILWATGHHFWASNILSADKLRKQFDRLRAQKNGEQKRGNNDAGYIPSFGDEQDFSEKRSW